MKRFSAIVAVFLALTNLACSGSSTSPSASSPAGGWSGQITGFPTNLFGGQCTGQSCAQLSFWVNKNNTVTCFGQSGTPRGSSGWDGCQPDSTPTIAPSGDSIQEGRFVVSPGSSTWTATGIFDSDSTAHGTVNIPIGPNGQGTGGTQYNWTATKVS